MANPVNSIATRKRSARWSTSSSVPVTKRLKDDGGQGNEPTSDNAGVSSHRATRSRATNSIVSELQKPKGRGSAWSPDVLLSNPKSKLTSCNLTELINRHAWEMLTPEDQAECLAYVQPPDLVNDLPTKNGTSPGLAKSLREQFFEINSVLQDDLRTFQEDLADGRFETAYLERARLARDKRLKGDFDKWKDDQYELWWGQKQKLAIGMLAGDTTKLKLTDLARNKMLQIQDIWKYSRTFRGGVTVRKELTCTEVDAETFSLTFLCPPKEDEYLRAGVEPMLIKGVETPTTLETRLLDEDARIRRSDRPNGNAFKAIRIVRGNEDIGSLFDVRMSAFEKLQQTNGQSSAR